MCRFITQLIVALIKIFHNERFYQKVLCETAIYSVEFLKIFFDFSDIL